MIQKLVALLINAGIQKDSCIELAEKINLMYEELEREKQSAHNKAAGKIGGRVKGMKGINKYRLTDPAKYQELVDKRNQKIRKAYYEKTQ